MKRSTKIALIIAAVLILCGGLLFAAALTQFDWNFKMLSTDDFESNRHTFDADIQNITVETNTADILFSLSDTEQTKVECYELRKAKHRVYVEENTLRIELQDEQKWYDHIGIRFKTPEITVYLPKKTYDALSVCSSTGSSYLSKEFSFQRIDITQSTGAVSCYANATEQMKIRTSTGEIYLKDGKMGALELEVSTGDVTLENITCKSVESVGSTGDVTLKNTVAEGALFIKRSTGRVRFWDCDAAEIFIRTDTGDVRGTLLTEKIFFTETDTGSVTTPKTVSGGKCEIITDTGDIYVEIK